MKSIWKYIIAQQGLFYKSLLILSSSILILYLFPLGGQFKYEFQKGRVWQYPDFYSPFDFSILKTDNEIKKNEEEALAELKLYLRADEQIKNEVFAKYPEQFSLFFEALQNPIKFDSLYDFGNELLEEIYFYGVLPPNYNHLGNSDIFLIQEQLEIPINIEELFRSEELFEFINGKMNGFAYTNFTDIYKDLFLS